MQIDLVVTNVVSKKSTNCSGELLIRQDEKGIFVALVSGGQTGFENFLIRKGDPIEAHEWCACIGRKFEYDRVVVPKEEMERAYREAGIIK
ncbi:hypothetical protein [Azohydromonas lata]|uniref:hypothetical protein n=1 Tax=Azohydromonas lata TaxID=45677 RepID=UPI001470A1CA|nr:hypothetical protein [Azohydromonas lata]